MTYIRFELFSIYFGSFQFQNTLLKNRPV